MAVTLDNKNRRAIDNILSRIATRCRIKSTALQSIPNNAWTATIFHEAMYDPVGMFSATTSLKTRITVPSGGVYAVGGTITFASNATGVRVAVISHNAATSVYYTCQSTVPGSSDGNAGLSVYSEYSCTANDYFRIFLYQNSGGALNVVGSREYSAHFWLHKVG